MPELKDLNNVSQTSEELSEIIGKVPNKIFIRTTYAMSILLAIFFLAAYFIKYPEKVSGEVIIYNESQPIKIINQQNTQLARLFVEDGASVSSGQPLALISSATDYESIAYLRKMIENYQYVFRHIEEVIQNDNITLSFGEMQSEYNLLISNLVKFKELVHPANQLKLRSLSDIKKRNDSIKSILNRRSTANLDEFSKESQRFKDYTKLYESGVISKHEYYNAIGSQFNAKSQIDNNEKEMLQQNLVAIKASQDANDYAYHLSSEREKLYHDIYANIRNIHVYIRNWDQKYLIKSPKSGKCSFNSPLTVGQYLKMGEELFVILTPNKGVFGVANISSEGIGNVETNQKARIKLKKYPYHEYGMVEGRVKKINAIPNDNTYRLTIKIDHVEQKELREKLKNEEEALGEVDIITKDYTLLDRLLMNIYKTLDK